MKRKSANGCRATFSLGPNSNESEKAWSSFNLKIFFAVGALKNFVPIDKAHLRRIKIRKI
jgi:hypothetical protein